MNDVEHISADPPVVAYERSSRAVIRLIVSTAGIAAVALLGELLPATSDGLEADLRRTAGGWAKGLGSFGDASALTVAILTLVVSLGIAVFQRRTRHVLSSLAAAAGAVAVVIVAARIGGTSPGRLIGEEWVLAIAASSAAVTATSFAVRSTPITRWAPVALWFFVGLGVLGADVSLAARAIALLAGTAVGATAALVFGTPSRRVGGDELRDALLVAGLPVSDLAPHGGDARGSQPWVATLTSGSPIFVKVTAVDELRSDQLFRFWRRVRLRRAGDERSPVSVRRAVEHEAFVGERARTAGVATPSVLSIGILDDDRGMFAAYHSVDGSTLQDLDDISDTLMRSAWSQVQVLRRARIAHRDLRSANVMAVDDEAWIIDFGFAEVAASQDLLDRDLAEMLVSMAALVGTERAVETASAVLGADELTMSIPWIQPLAVSTASRNALDKSGFEELRERVRTGAGISAPELPQLQRISRKAVISTLALGIAIWTVLPQITKDIDWRTVLSAQPVWAAVALVASLLSYVGAAISMSGSVPDELPLRSSFPAQVASSFTNRVTPAKVGGMALNVRFLTKQGFDAATAATGVAVSTAAGTVAHIALTVVAIAWAGSSGVKGVRAPSGMTVLYVVLALVAVVVIMAAVPPARRWFVVTALPSLRRSWRSFSIVIRTPRNVAMLLGGSALVTTANITAFEVSLRAFGVDIALPSVALVYLAGSALASAAPTPGGLGATEAALVAGLALISVPESKAIPAVLLFRLATFWIPILPGWIAFTVMQRRGDI